MWFFQKRNQGVSQREMRESIRRNQERADATIQALARGQLPPYIEERIERQNQHGLPWTSDLTVNEWLVLSQYQIEPLGMAMGSCFYHVGYSVASSAGVWYSTDLTHIERALYEGRNLALSRLQMEAKAMGANAVVGVRLNSHRPGFHGHETEFTAFGTAVKVKGLEKTPEQPLLCTVSGQELVKLLAEGTLPVGFAMGVCVHYVYTSQQDRWQERSWYNQEIPRFSQAVYHTRSRATANMWREAKNLGGTGVLGHETSLSVMEVDVERGENDEREDHVLEFVSLGTVVDSTSLPIPLRPQLVLDISK